jgi:hypothetical protein
MQTEA